MTPPERPASAPPTHVPSSRESADLELLCDGALAPLAGFEGADGTVTLHVPHDLAVEAIAAGTLLLLDAEGAARATVHVDGTYEAGAGTTGIVGDVAPLFYDGAAPFRRLRRSPGAVRESYGDDYLLVPVTSPPTVEDLAIIAAKAGNDPVVLLVLYGTRATPLPPPALVRATLAARRSLRGAEVVVTSVVPRSAQVQDDVLTRRVLENYAAKDVVWPHGHGRLPDDVAAIVSAATAHAQNAGLVLFFTGLSGSGKSTIARAVQDVLLEQHDRAITSLDGDVVRRHLSQGLGFSVEDRERNVRRIGWVASEIARHGGVVVASPIAPFDQTRRHVRELVTEAGATFVLVHVATPLEECERRDRKGLYARARAGEIPDFTGISSPYEVPHDAELSIDTTQITVDEAAMTVVAHLREQGHLPDNRRTDEPLESAPTP